MSAEATGIFIGLLLAIGIFAFKTAAGEYYYCSLPVSGMRKTVFMTAVSAIYLLLFILAFLLLDMLALFRTTDGQIVFLRSGTLVHLLLCAGLFLWGIHLLCRKDACHLDQWQTHGWLLLTVPCPVCFFAVLLICAFAKMLFPDRMGILHWGIPLVFLFLNLCGFLLLNGICRIFKMEPLELTGRVMIVIALYFVLILLIAPQFRQIDKLYAAAAHSPAFPINRNLAFTLGAAVLAASFGFLRELLHRKG